MECRGSTQPPQGNPKNPQEELFQRTPAAGAGVSPDGCVIARGFKPRTYALTPADAQSRRDLAMSLGNTGYTMAQMGKMGQAETGLKLYRKSLAIFESLLAVNPDNPNAMRDTAVSYNYFGDVHKFLASASSAPLKQRIEHWRQAREWYERSRRR